MNTTGKRRWNITKVNLWFDIAIFIAALFAPALMLTGLPLHEWLGIGLALAVITHLLLHWQWLVQTTKRLFGRTTWTARINYVLNSLFFIAFTTVILTGLMMSKVALPSLGIQLAQSGMTHQLHSLASNAIVVILALHVGMHGKWIVNCFNRYAVQPVLRLGRRTGTGLEAQALSKEGAA